MYHCFLSTRLLWALGPQGTFDLLGQCCRSASPTSLFYVRGYVYKTHGLKNNWPLNKIRKQSQKTFYVEPIGRSLTHSPCSREPTVPGHTASTRRTFLDDLVQLFNFGPLAQLQLEPPSELDGGTGPAGRGHLHSQPGDGFVLFATLCDSPVRLEKLPGVTSTFGAKLRISW